MKVDLYQTEKGQWQADVRLGDGRTYHGVGSSPGDALIELGFFWKGRELADQLEERARDLITLARLVTEHPTIAEQLIPPGLPGCDDPLTKPMIEAKRDG